MSSMSNCSSSQDHHCNLSNDNKRNGASHHQCNEEEYDESMAVSHHLPLQTSLLRPSCCPNTMHSPSEHGTHHRWNAQQLRPSIPSTRNTNAATTSSYQEQGDSTYSTSFNNCQNQSSSQPQTRSTHNRTHRKCDSSPQDTLETDAETLSSFDSDSEDSSSFSSSASSTCLDSNADIPVTPTEDNATSYDNVDNFSYAMQQQRVHPRFGCTDVEEQYYDSDQSGKYKGHFHPQQHSQHFQHSRHEDYYHPHHCQHCHDPTQYQDSTYTKTRHKPHLARGLTTSQILACWLLLLGLAMMAGNMIQMELFHRGRRGELSLWKASEEMVDETLDRLHRWEQDVFTEKQQKQQPQPQQHHHQRQQKHVVKDAKDPFWFSNNRNGPLETTRQTDLEVIRRTTSGKHRNFSVRLRPSEKEHGMIRKDLLLAAIDNLALCSKVDRIEVDGNVDGVWLNHPSGKVRRLLQSEEGGENGGGDGSEDQYAVLLLDVDVALSCKDLEHGFKMWTKSPERAVGFLPFRHEKLLNQEMQHIDESLPKSLVSASGWVIESIQSIGHPYSLLSDRAMFLHRRYLHSDFLSVAQETGKGRPCDHLLLSMTVSSISRKPPIGVLSHPVDMRTSHMMQQRREIEINAINEMSQCLIDVMEVLGLNDLPLEESMYLGHTKL